MGLATIDPQSHQVQSKLHKIPKFEMYGHPDAVRTQLIAQFTDSYVVLFGLKSGNVAIKLHSSEMFKRFRFNFR